MYIENIKYSTSDYVRRIPLEKINIINSKHLKKEYDTMIINWR